MGIDQKEEEEEKKKPKSIGNSMQWPSNKKQQDKDVKKNNEKLTVESQWRGMPPELDSAEQEH